jgi:streptomycin 6-kinase
MEQAVEAWELTEVEPVGEGNVALVCWAKRDGEPLVLKLNPRGHPEDKLIAAQATGLDHWAPTGIIAPLLDRRDGGMTLLLERVLPGDALDDAHLTWEQKLATIAALVARLHVAGEPPATTPTVVEYAAFWRDELNDPGLARELEELIATTDRDVLLHGDLHPGNVLSGPTGWKVIDPSAFRGDPHADIWALICPQAPSDGRILGHAELYAEAAGLDLERALAWARVRAAAECSGWLSAEAVRRIGG